MKLKGIKHIFFDLDHTLWDFERNSGLTFAYIFKKRDITIPVSDFLEIYSPINFEFWRLYRNNEVSKEELRYGRLKKSFDLLNLKIDDKVINNLSSDYINHLADHNYLFEGAIALLEHLRPKYGLHIITNGFNEVQGKKLANSKIANFFDTIVTSELVGVKKPNPKIFQYALQQANAKADQSLMIGDNLEADIIGANHVGLKSIYFSDKDEQLPKNQIRVDKLSSIITLL